MEEKYEYIELGYDVASITFEIKDHKLCFLSFYQPDTEKDTIEIYGKEVFATNVKELHALLEEKNGEPSEYGNTFLNISTGYYQQFTQEAVEAEIEEMKESGEYEENKEWLLEDLEKSKYCMTFGIGKKGYYDGV